MSLNVQEIRKDFPFFEKSDLAYLDNSATTQRPRQVIEAVDDYYYHHNSNPFRGLYELRESMRVDCGLPLDVLSCGMSDDFGIAVEEGSTLVRLGRIVFDPAYELDV